MGELPRRDRDLIEEVCARLGLADAAVTALEGGTRNRSYRLADRRRAVVLRVEGEDDEAYAVARAAEHVAQRLASEHGLAPRLLLTGPGHAVTKFVPSAPWSRERAASPEGSAQVGAWLARLHALPVPAGLREVRFLASFGDYVGRLRDAGPVLQLMDTAKCVAQELGEFTPVPCHNDLHHLNLIDSPHGLVAIDWEYAGAGDPRLDLAGYVAYHDLTQEAVDALLEAYGVLCPGPSRRDLDRARWLFEAVWWAWLELRRQLEHTEPEAVQSARRRLRARLDEAGQRG